MNIQSLSACIVQSLKEREMVSSFPDVVLSRNRSEVLRYEETDYWDYKERLDLDNPVEVARLAKDVLGFHNAKGGVVIIGVSSEYRVIGITRSQLRDTNFLQGKLRKYIGPNVALFQDSIPVPNKRFLQLVFVPKRTGAPVAVCANGPLDKSGRPEIRLNEYHVRIHDEVKLCRDPGDYERLFAGLSMDQLQAYSYDIDEPYYRLLAPHCDRFIGRTRLLSQVNEALNSRHPVIALDGTGGVGKTAVAIELVRHLYDSKKYVFIVSLSAKSRVWYGHIESRRAGFSGLTEFLQEVAKVLQLAGAGDMDRLKKSVIENMRGFNGLLLVDNVEEIQDWEVFHFLSMEVPEPVKVLVTSRIERPLGALPVSVPEMSEDDARELLFHELNRVKYTGYINEQDTVEEVLRVTGRLPLALKWTAALAGTYKSLKDALGRLRKTDAKKREFLNFCFKTMYDELSPLARDAALLCPYLGEDWNVVSVAMFLDKPEDEAERAIEELKARGILLPSTSLREGALQLLPLTVDFLNNRWHENSILRQRVNDRIAEAIGSGEDEGILINWPREKRVEVLHRKAAQLMEGGELPRARQLVKLALNWSSCPGLRFLEGRIIYESAERSEGISYMRAALGQAEDPRQLTDERVYLAQALLSHGGTKGQGEALKLLESAIPHSDTVTRESINTYCGLALQMREYSSISRVLSGTENPTYLRWFAKALWGALGDEMFVHFCGESLLKTFDALAKWRETDRGEREQYEQAGRRITSILRKE